MHSLPVASNINAYRPVCHSITLAHTVRCVYLTQNAIKDFQLRTINLWSQAHLSFLYLTCGTAALHLWFEEKQSFINVTFYSFVFFCCIFFSFFFSCWNHNKYNRVHNINLLSLPEEMLLFNNVIKFKLFNLTHIVFFIPGLYLPCFLILFFFCSTLLLAFCATW